MSTRLFLLLALVLAPCGCQRITEADQQAALANIKANVAAMQRADVAAVLATIHPESPAYLNTPELIGNIVQKYKLTYQLEEAAIEQVTTDGIRVRFVQVTKKVEGPDDFPDNRVEGMHLLKRDGKAWKIWFTQVRQARTLDGLPLPRL